MKWYISMFRVPTVMSLKLGHKTETDKLRPKLAKRMKI